MRRGFKGDDVDELSQRLPKLVQPTPFVRNVRGIDAIWVKPEIYCEVHQSGYDTDGVLIQPNFKVLLRAEKQ